MKTLYFIMPLFVFSNEVSAQFSDGKRIDEVSDANDIKIKKFEKAAQAKTQENIWDRVSAFGNSTINQELDFSSYELLSANLNFTDKDQTQKLVFAPLRAINLKKDIKTSENFSWLANTKINIALKDKITTLGFAIGGDNSAYYSKKSRRIFKAVFQSNRVSSASGLNTGETFPSYKVRVLDPYVDKMDKDLSLYDSLRVRNVFKWSLGYNYQLFPNLFSSGNYKGFDTLNFYNSKSQSIGFTAGYSHLNSLLNITTSYNHIFSRTSAVKGQKVVPYYSPSLSLSLRLFRFIDYSELKKLPAFKKSLFIPSLNFGLIWEGKFADKDAKFTTYYQDNILNQKTVTPFFDILISPALQFRIGLPVSRIRYSSGDILTNGGANIQYNFKLSNLNP